jgi:hypothetical protein
MGANDFLSTLKANVSIAKKKTSNSLNKIPYSKGSLTNALNKAILNLKLVEPFSRQNLVQICKEMGVVLSHIQATEALLFSRKNEDEPLFTHQ